MKWQFMVAGLVFGVSLAGQSPAPGSTPAPAPAPAPTGEVKSKPANRIEQRAQSMRDQIDQGKTVNSHVRVAVRLKNGNKLLGVVKDGKLVERVDGLRFVEAQAQERGAGIRIWYTGGTRNWVFVPFNDFADYEVLQQLSNKQIQAIEEEMQMRERSAAERQAAPKPGTNPAGDSLDPAGNPAPIPGAGNGSEGATADPAAATPPTAKNPGGAASAKTGDAAKKPGDDAAEPGSADLEKQRAWFALLQAYPPAGGWGQQKRDEIARRKVVIGADPSAAEKNFVAQFDEWKKACEHFKVGPAPKPSEGSDDVSADDRPSSPRRKKGRQQERQDNQ